VSASLARSTRTATKPDGLHELIDFNLICGKCTPTALTELTEEKQPELAREQPTNERLVGVIT